MIIFVFQLDDPTYKNYKDIKELPKHILDEITVFFEDYKKLEVKKFVEIGGESK